MRGACGNGCRLLYRISKGRHGFIVAKGGRRCTLVSEINASGLASRRLCALIRAFFMEWGAFLLCLLEETTFKSLFLYRLFGAACLIKKTLSGRRIFKKY